VIGFNKWDIVEKDTLTAKEYEKILKTKLRLYDYVPVVFISAVTKQRIFKLLNTAKDVHSNRGMRIPTSSLNEDLLKEIQRYPPSSKTGNDIKINYVTQVKSMPPVFAFFANEPKMITETYKRFLENKIRKYYGFAGVPLTLVFKSKRK
jgi:GTP-binding protein